MADDIDDDNTQKNVEVVVACIVSRPLPGRDTSLRVWKLTSSRVHFSRDIWDLSRGGCESNKYEMMIKQRHALVWAPGGRSSSSYYNQPTAQVHGHLSLSFSSLCISLVMVHLCRIVVPYRTPTIVQHNHPTKVVLLANVASWIT